MDRMAILIGNDRGSAIVPMLEREGLRVEVMRSPEQALERLQEIMDRRQASFSAQPVVPMGPTEEGNSVLRGSAAEEGVSWERESAPMESSELPGGTVGLDRRLAAVQERARALESEEQKIISEALQHAGGNKTAASRLLGISRYALQRRLRRFAKPQNPI